MEVDEINIPTSISNIMIEDLILKSGVNVVALDADESRLITYEGTGMAKFLSTTLAFGIQSISITD